MKRMIRASYDDRDGQPDKMTTSTLTRTILVEMYDVEVEVDENSIDFENFDWAAPDGRGDYDTDWESDESDPVIILDDTTGVAEKVEKLLLDKIFEHVDKYRAFNITKCEATLVYLVPDVEYEVSSYGKATGHDVSYDKKDIYWSEADSTIECDYERL